MRENFHDRCGGQLCLFIRLAVFIDCGGLIGRDSSLTRIGFSIYR